MNYANVSIPLSLSFFLFSQMKMIRKRTSASIRIPMTGHNGPKLSENKINSLTFAFNTYIALHGDTVDSWWNIIIKHREGVGRKSEAGKFLKPTSRC